jgi:predicted murein hydrolase (TIGR00659 family)
MEADFFVYLRSSPLTALTATLLVYQLAVELQRRLGGSSLVNPVLVSVAVLVLVLKATGTRYETYFAGAQFINFLLGPAVVALAVPLHRQLPLIREAAVPIAVVVVAGGVVAIFAAVLPAKGLGAPHDVVLSIAPKSTTAPVALGLARDLGGIPALTAALTITTGIVGAIFGQGAARLAGVRDERALGLGMGIASHGIGTARAFQLSDTAGAFASLGFALNACLTAVVLPLLADGLGII